MRDAEKAAGRKPDPAMDAFLKAQTLEGGDESIVTDYMLKLLGLDVSFYDNKFSCRVCKPSPLPYCPHFINAETGSFSHAHPVVER